LVVAIRFGGGEAESMHKLGRARYFREGNEDVEAKG
jgi:hypothetical protein